MTQEGQALPSPTPPENPVEPNTSTTTDPPKETHDKTDEDKLDAGTKEETEEGKQEEEVKEREEGEAHREGEGGVEVKGDRGEGELKEEREERGQDERQQRERGADGDWERMRGEGCKNMETSLMGVETTYEVVEMKEEGEGKENEEIHPCTEEEAANSQQAGRLVHKNAFIFLSPVNNCDHIFSTFRCQSKHIHNVSHSNTQTHLP